MSKIQLKESFQVHPWKVYSKNVDESFPAGAKRTRSATICRDYTDRLVRLLKDGSLDSDKNFRHLVKRNGFQLLDLPEAGLRDVLMVKVSKEKQVSLASCTIVVHGHDGTYMYQT